MAELYFPGESIEPVMKLDDNNAKTVRNNEIYTCSSPLKYTQLVVYKEFLGVGPNVALVK